MIPTELQSNHYVSSISNISAAPINSTETSNHSLTSKSLPPITIKAVPKSIFEETLSHASLPPPGPLYYAARRALWLAPTNEAPLPSIPSTSRQRLEHLLGMPGAVQNEDVWKAGVEKVWKGLVAGGRLKRRLPMNIVIKIIHAGWLRDPETWPLGAIAPEPDDVLDEPPICQPIPRATTEYSSGVTTPWTAMSATGEDGAEGLVSRRASGMVGIEERV